MGEFGSIPFIERLILTIKKECTTRFLFPFSHSSARKELALFKAWYNHLRPHQRLRGSTPDEINAGAEPIWKRSLLEPEDRAARLVLKVRYLEGRKHLPIVRVERAA